MRFSSTAGSALLVLSVCTLLIITGIKMRPGIGILCTILLIPAVMWIRGNGLDEIGIQTPASWISTVLQALGYGIVLSILSFVLIEPLSAYLTNSTPDYGPVEKIRGNVLALLQTLVFVWLFVAFVEEIIFRGFLMSEISKVIGPGMASLSLNLVLTSVVFGFCHAYQNASGIITTGFIGALFGIAFMMSGKNLWVAILTHGIFDTIGLVMIYFGADKYLHQFYWKSS